eukprot:1083967-Prymnesium_polylepis.1
MRRRSQSRRWGRRGGLSSSLYQQKSSESCYLDRRQKPIESRTVKNYRDVRAAGAAEGGSDLYSRKVSFWRTISSCAPSQRCVRPRRRT